MNTRAPSLPVLFVGSTLVSAAVILGVEALLVDSFVQKLAARPISAGYFAFSSVVFGALVVFIVAVIREVKRAKRPEMAGYRQAVKTGRVSGDVTHWPEWIRHDRKVNVFRAITVAAFAGLGGNAVADGLWWQAIFLFPMAVFNGRECWRTRQQLATLDERLSSPTT